MPRSTALAFITFALLTGGPASGQVRQLDSADVERLVTAVGQVVSPAGDSAEIKGSGVVVSPDGSVITCYHVLGRSAKPGAQVLFDPVDAKGLFQRPDPKETLQLEVVRTLPEYDLALLRVKGYADGRPLKKDQQFHFLPIGKAEDLHLLDLVYIIGFPFVGGDTVTIIEGHVAGKDTANQWLKLDASVSRGYSGGAVVNGRGELVGVPTELRADIEDLRPDYGGTSDAAVLYGALSWVRPSELVPRLLAASRDAPLLPSPDEPATGRIQGVVVSSDGKPLAGALVGLLKLGSSVATHDNLLTYARTDDAGNFVLRTLPGSYTLRTHCAGYANSSQPVRLTDTVRVRIALTKQPAKSGSAPGRKQ
jgi:S1-C subfamily serine protease